MILKILFMDIGLVIRFGLLQEYLLVPVFSFVRFRGFGFFGIGP